MFSITVDKHDYRLWRRVLDKQWPGDLPVPFHLPALEDIIDNYCRDQLYYKWSASDTKDCLDLLVYYHDPEEELMARLLFDYTTKKEKK